MLKKTIQNLGVTERIVFLLGLLVKEARKSCFTTKKEKKNKKKLVVEHNYIPLNM